MKSNRLIHSHSPYLLQHAYNPVDWYPWGEEALTKAQTENKPILVSIGYSACHWCHVMEKESFEDMDTAEIMNKHFVCIKIDREERPDLDNIYMDAVQIMGLQGGWPLNVFLMPNQKPFYGGTYFPNIQWKGLLANISDAFEKHFDQLYQSAEGFGVSLNRKETEKYNLVEGERILSQEELKEIIQKLEVQFDPKWGGLKRAPKFPLPSIWIFILDYALLKKDDALKEKVLFTLRKIGMGGIYDHLRGGFARYSVDGEWFAPHFEKMLYDNGQLLELFSKAFQITQDPFFLEKINETIAWLEAEMIDLEGGFYAAQDADSEGVEGKFYTWNFSEVKDILGDDTSWFANLYNLKEKGNWEESLNILFQTEQYADISNGMGISDTDFRQKLADTKEKLLKVRNKRIYPGLDDKVISGWNGLMISGLVQAYFSTRQSKPLELALKNGEFLITKMTNQGELMRSYKNGKAYTPGFLEDYAAVIKGYIALYQATFDGKWLFESKNLCDKVLQHFYDEEDGFFFFNNPDAEKLIANKKELFDNVIPASNSIMAQNLHDLGLYFYDDNYLKLSKNMLGRMQKMILTDPGYLPNWAKLYMNFLVPKAEIAIIGKGAIEKAKELQFSYQPNFILAATEAVGEKIPLLDLKTPDPEGNALIYVCFNKVCQKPVSNIADVYSQFPTLA